MRGAARTWPILNPHRYVPPGMDLSPVRYRLRCGYFDRWFIIVLSFRRCTNLLRSSDNFLIFEIRRQWQGESRKPNSEHQDNPDHENYNEKRKE